MSGEGWTRLQGGRVYDPANGKAGDPGDLWIHGGQIQNPPDPLPAARVIDVSGEIVMPGGIDMHCHVAGSKVGAARQMRPELLREEHPSVTSIRKTGQQYLGLGYTTCFDAAISPLAARDVHQELGRLPYLDAGFFILVGNLHLLLEAISAGDRNGLDAGLGWLLQRTGGYAPKIVNPGGVELWKQRRTGNARDLDQPIDGFSGVTPRRIIEEITAAGNRLGLPHPVHIHGNNLGLPGNAETTLATMETLSGLRAHLTHIQFHSYGKKEGAERDAGGVLTSEVPRLAEHVNRHPELTVDVGQVLFGRTTSMTGDGPLGYYLQQLHGERWYSADTELESGCGVSPIEYRNRNEVHALQWAIGLEWYLLVRDPWQIAMSTDHPNGGSFLAYPHIIRLLMDKPFRDEAVQRLPARIRRATVLGDIDREYSLEEIAVITRAGPARMLGLTNKGHLGVGADADITVYHPGGDWEQVFSVPTWVFKKGVPVIRDLEWEGESSSQILSHRPDYDRERDAAIEEWVSTHYSLKAEHFGVSPAAPLE